MGHVQKRAEGKWRARYRDPAGTERSKTFDTQREAKDWLRDTEKALADGTYVGRSDDTFGEWAKAWTATLGDRGLETRRAYRSVLDSRVLPRFEDQPVQAIRRPAVRAWVTEMADEGLAAGSIDRAIRVARSVFNCAIDDGGLRHDPTLGVKAPRPAAHNRQFLTAEQVAEVAATVGERWTAFVYTAGYMGARAGELVALRRSNLDLLRQRMHIRESVGLNSGIVGPPKSGRERSVAIPRFLVEMLAAHLEHGDEHVFPGPKGGRMNYGTWYRSTWKPAVASVGLEGLRFHDMRHTCASLLAAQGAHPRAVMERLGHTSVKMTLDLYSHLFPSLDDALTDGLDAAFEAAAASPRPEPLAEVRSIR